MFSVSEITRDKGGGEKKADVKQAVHRKAVLRDPHVALTSEEL